MRQAPPRLRLPSTSAALVAGALALCLAGAGEASAQGIGRGFELERMGRLDQAAALYLATVRADPANIAALLGLERVLPRLGRLAELPLLVERATQVQPANADLQGLLLRVYVALNEPDSARAVALRWARARPREAGPYREWAIALEDAGERVAAREVLLAGRQALGQPAAFAIELAELRSRAGDWDDAAREWARAVTAAPAQGGNAAAQLGDAPRERRAAVVRILTRGDSHAPAAVRQLAAQLLLAWGDPLRAWTTFEPSVSDSSPAAAYALGTCGNLAAGPGGGGGTPAAWRVRGLALSKFADIVPEEIAVRARADAARAFLEAGDPAAARTQLARVAADSAAPFDAQQLAQATLIRALIRADRLDSAAAQLTSAGDRLAGDDRAALRFALARAWMVRGALALADSSLADDSSVEATALHGWIALYRGDVRQARALFIRAGPYAGERRDATERTAMIALTERIVRDPFPALGSALLSLERGDSGTALTQLQRAAAQLAPDEGRGDLLLLAGQVAARTGGRGKAEATAAALFDEVLRIGGSGAAPAAAELAWAHLLLRQGETALAVRHLEHLILTFPESAVVPQARRELEQAKGAIPKA